MMDINSDETKERLVWERESEWRKANGLFWLRSGHNMWLVLSARIISHENPSAQERLTDESGD